ncbi:colicin immunity domain-containing protein [Pelagibacterium montanilacus]|uniref:colicin immunity domain-containing protein n=1 Tax=Pelagibacterium montanilacus TaxID=2185280 RepID=UPI0013E0092F|nr:colicin immunity domain-containing protein [Pelagibacterium montanilacus]
MTDFAEGRMNGPAFESRFLEMFRAHRNGPMPYAVDLTFYAVDAYCADPALRDTDDIDEGQLRDQVRGYLARLDEPWPEPGRN